MKAAEDFLVKVLAGYVVAAAKVVMEDEVIDSIHELAHKIVERYIRVLPDCPEIDSTDRVLTYSCEVLTLGLLWSNYLDATCEGDGMRILLIWKFLLLVYKATNQTNYCKEAAFLLAQYQFILSPRKANQLLYSRFVNTQGRRGHNVPCDLHNEHLNRRLKTILRNL